MMSEFATRLADWPRCTRHNLAFNSNQGECMRGIGSAKSLLSKQEQHLYGRLVRAFPGHVILAHVALPGLSELDPVVADFLICRPDFSVLAMVELARRDAPRDIQTTSQHHRDRILGSAGLKVIRVLADDLPAEAALKALVAAVPPLRCAS